jgi:hypothetical protein
MPAQLAVDEYGHPIQALAQGANQTLAVGVASAQSLAFAAGSKVVRVVATSNCWIVFGVNPTAAATSGNGSYVPAGAIELWRVTPGHRVAVIQDSAAGTLSITELQ